jgi:hypothetical protein
MYFIELYISLNILLQDDSRWRIENGKCRMKDERWRMEN